MQVRVKLAAAIALAGVMAVGGTAAATGDNGRGVHHGGGGAQFTAFLSGYEEVPPVSTPASGTFRATIETSGAISWELTYRDLSGPPTQAHIHFGQRAVNGGVSAFLCSNMPGAPAGTQPCPPPPARITGTIGPSEVVGPAAQGIAPGELDELVAAMRAGITYANVHSEPFPDGEMRGQIEPSH
jgi:hypothetical protein